MYKLLIVDDNYDDREGIKDLIDWRGMGIEEVYTAKNGLEGYEKAMEVQPTLIVTDVSMPVMDGLDMSAKIIEKLPETKIIFMSCFDESQYIRNAIDINTFAYLLKPINIAKLTQSVGKILKIKKKEQETVDVINLLEQQIKKNMPLLKEQMTRNYLYGNIKENINGNFAKFDMEIRRFCATAVLRIDRFNIGGNEDLDKNYMTANQIKDYIINFRQSDSRICAFVQDKKTIGLLVYLDDSKDENEGINQTLDLINSVKDAINTEFLTTVTICIGGVSGDFDDMPMLFGRAEYILYANVYSKSDSIILVDEIGESVGFSDHNIVNVKNELRGLLERNDKDEIKNFVNKYYAEDSVAQKSIIKGFTLSLISILQFETYEMGESFSDIFGEDMLIWNKLMEFDTILDIRQWLINILTGISSHLNTGEKARHLQIVNGIKEIVEKEYGQIKSVDQIVRRLYISANHANFVFKKNTGYTIFDYLIKVRMDNAKRLLKGDYRKIYEVADAVGYKSNTYFAMVFKEYTGMSPKAYRDKD